MQRGTAGLSVASSLSPSLPPSLLLSGQPPPTPGSGQVIMGARPPPWTPHQGLWVWMPQHRRPLQKPTTPAPTSLRPLTVSRSTGAVSGGPRRHQNPRGPRLHSQACLRPWHQIPQAWDQEDCGKGLPQARCLWRPSFPHNPVCPRSNRGSLRLWSPWKGLQAPPHSKLK